MFGNCFVRDYVAKLGAKIKGGLSKLGLGHAHFNMLQRFVLLSDVPKIMYQLFGSNFV